MWPIINVFQHHLENSGNGEQRAEAPRTS